MTRRRLALLLALLLAAAVSAGCASGPPARVSAPSSAYAGTSIPGVFTLPATTFTDDRGRSFDLRRDTRRPVTLVFFGYTSCPDVCPTTMADIALALRRSSGQVRAATDVLMITTDPRRDTPRTLHAWLGRFDPSFVGLTAPLPVIERTAKRLGIALEGATPLPGGGYEVGHGAQVLAFDAADRSTVLWSPGTPVSSIAADLARLVSGGAAP